MKKKKINKQYMDFNFALTQISYRTNSVSWAKTEMKNIHNTFQLSQL